MTMLVAWGALIVAVLATIRVYGDVACREFLNTFQMLNFYP